MERKDIDATTLKAIKENDTPTLHTCLCMEIKLDPQFKTGRYEEILAYIKKQGVTVEVPYEKQSAEFKLPSNEWTELYFYRLTEWLRENFAPTERIPHIKEVGRAMFPEKKQSEPDFQKASQEQKTAQRAGVSSGKAAPRKKPGTVAAAIAAVVAVLALVALIVKLLK